MKSFYSLTKMGIVIFVLLSAACGYAIGMPVGQEFDYAHFATFLMGTFFLSSGSFAINQAQEWVLDLRMPRTQRRPVPSGELEPWQAWFIGLTFVAFGLLLLFVIKPMVAYLGLATVLMYNGLYTLLWKRKWVFGAVPGAIPGAMPVVLGYAAHRSWLFTPECAYLFLILFLWQMPHFWTLAIRFRDDYKQGGVPVMPASLGTERALYHIGLYTFAYVGVALASPWFVQAKYLYLLLVVPVAIKILIEFYKFIRGGNERKWLPFFLWVNASVIIFLAVPIIDKWLHYRL
jgi:protoheme IX farnesyltransferase